MNKKQFEELLKPLIGLYEEIENDMIINILNRLEGYTTVQGSLEWYLDKLEELNVLKKDNLDVIKSNKKNIKKILEELIKNTHKKSSNLDRLNSLYKENKININPSDVFNSVSTMNLISEALRDTNNIMDLINTKAIEGANEAYKRIINKAYIETSSGVYSYQESIRRALNEFAKQGISFVHYDSGISMTIESAIRRDIITRSNKLIGDVEINNAKELGTNLIYVDQHLGARTRTPYTKEDYEAHDEWQGKVYMIEGSSEKYPNLYEKTGYGEMLGLKGINCYHNMMATFEWEEHPKRITEEENAEYYEILKKQRYYERKVRSIKRENLIAKKTNDIDTLNKNKKRMKKLNGKYEKYLDNNNLVRDFSREYVESK